MRCHLLLLLRLFAAPAAAAVDASPAARMRHADPREAEGAGGAADGLDGVHPSVAAVVRRIAALNRPAVRGWAGTLLPAQTTC